MMTDIATGRKPRILILGGGYAGVSAARRMIKLGLPRRAEITLVNASPRHCLTTTTHRAIQCPAEQERMSLSLPDLLGPDVRFVCGRVDRIDAAARQVHADVAGDRQTWAYDLAVIALGWENRFYGIPGLVENALVLRNVQDALAIGDRLESSFRALAERPQGDWRGHVLVGGAGLTGMEVVSELAEWLPELARDCGLDPRQVRLTLVGAFMPGFDPRLAARAREFLQARGVTVMSEAMIEAVEPHAVRLKDGPPLPESVVIWAGGVRGSSRIEESGLAVDRSGRACVNEFLQARDQADLFLAGDCALTLDAGGRPVVQSAQFAVEEGRQAAGNIRRLLDGRPLRRFELHDLGVVVSLGRRQAVGLVRLGPLSLRVTGLAARLVKKVADDRYLWGIGALRMGRRLPA